MNKQSKNLNENNSYRDLGGYKENQFPNVNDNIRNVDEFYRPESERNIISSQINTFTMDKRTTNPKYENDSMNIIKNSSKRLSNKLFSSIATTISTGVVAATAIFIGVKALPTYDYNIEMNEFYVDLNSLHYNFSIDNYDPVDNLIVSLTSHDYNYEFYLNDTLETSQNNYNDEINDLIPNTEYTFLITGNKENDSTTLFEKVFTTLDGIIDIQTKIDKDIQNGISIEIIPKLYKYDNINTITIISGYYEQDDLYSDIPIHERMEHFMNETYTLDEFKNLSTIPLTGMYYNINDLAICAFINDSLEPIFIHKVQMPKYILNEFTYEINSDNTITVNYHIIDNDYLNCFSGYRFYINNVDYTYENIIDISKDEITFDNITNEGYKGTFTIETIDDYYISFVSLIDEIECFQVEKEIINVQE